MLNHNPVKIHLRCNQTSVFDIVKYLKLLWNLFDNIQMYLYIIVVVYIDYAGDQRKIYSTDGLKI